MASVKAFAKVSLAAAMAAAVIAPGPAHAGSVTVQIDPAPGADFAQKAGLDLPQLQAQLQSELSEAYQVLKAQSYLRNFGDAFAFTTKGLGVDYASNPTLFVVGVAGNLSLNVQNAYAPDSKTRPPIDAMGLNASFMGGVSLANLGVPLTVYGNFYKGSASFDQHRGDLTSWGAHAQLKLFAPRPRRSLGLPIQWGGLDVTTGVDYGRLKLALGSGSIRSIVPLQTPAGDAQLVANMTGTFDLDLRTYSIPLELTSNVTLLYFLTLYGGLGFDWQVGGGHDMIMNLGGNVSGTAPGVPKTELGTVTVTATEKVDPSVGHMRGLMGLQVNVFFVKLFAQLNVMPAKGLVGLGFGARVAY